MTDLAVLTDLADPAVLTGPFGPAPCRSARIG
jgi:hypothetical protein